MSTTPLTEAHIAAQERLREITVAAVRTTWQDLPKYDRANIPQWLDQVRPIVLAAQRQSVAVTNAYIARALETQPVGIDVAAIIRGARNGTPPEEVYQRPFVTVWTALDQGTRWRDAVEQGLSRAAAAAATDVQLAARGTFAALQAADPRIKGYRRAPDAGACSFCLLVAGAFVKRATAMGLHPYCGCSLVPELDPGDVTPVPEGVAVHEHGELGAILAAPGQQFTTEHELH